MDLMETTQFIDDVEEQSKFINKLLANLSKERTPEMYVRYIKSMALFYIAVVVEGVLHYVGVLSLIFRRVAQVEALMLMHQMMQEGSFTTWDEHFKRLLFTVCCFVLFFFHVSLMYIVLSCSNCFRHRICN